MRTVILAALLIFAIAIPARTNEWKTYNGHRYTSVQALHWTDGETQAVALGGHLVTINDMAENDWLVQNIINPLNGFAWIGLYQRSGAIEPLDGWVWASGDIITYTNWHDGEPNNLGGGEDWAELYTSAFGGNWNDIKPETDWSPPLFAVVEVTNAPEPSGFFTLLPCLLITLVSYSRTRK